MDTSSSFSPSTESHCIHDHDECMTNGHNHETYNDQTAATTTASHIRENHTWEAPEHDLCLPNRQPKLLLPVSEDVQDNVETLVDKTSTPLYMGWNYYYHLPNDKNWNVDSYKIIMSNIRTLEELMGMNEVMTDNIIKNCMLFVMRAGVTPMWEDAQNRQGGCFSYKVTNKSVTQVWRKLMYLLCGYTLTIDPTHMDLVNGITISPKRGFCIIKIWMRDCSLQDPAVITNIDQLLRNGCLFKAHSPEF